MKPNAFSRHSSPGNREAPAWECPLVGGSSGLMAAICGRAPTQDGARPFSSRCPSRRQHLERRARRAASGGYFGGGCRRLLPLDGDRTLAQIKALRRTLFDPKVTEHRGRIVNIPGTALSLSSPAWSPPCDAPPKSSAAWPNEIPTCRLYYGHKISKLA